MRLLSIDLLSINFEIPLVPPRTRRAADLDDFAGWLCNNESGLGLRPDQVRLTSWDDLFGYELVAQFFGENGRISRTADRIKLMIRNARTRGDWELVRRILVRFFTHMDLPEMPTTTFQANVHSRLPAADELESFFLGYPQPAIAARPALFSYVKITDWEADIRVVIEKSNALPDALFIGWETQFPNQQDWESFITSLPTMMENSLHLFDLSLTPMG